MDFTQISDVALRQFLELAGVPEDPVQELSQQVANVFQQNHPQTGFEYPVEITDLILAKQLSPKFGGQVTTKEAILQLSKDELSKLARDFGLENVDLSRILRILKFAGVLVESGSESVISHVEQLIQPDVLEKLCASLSFQDLQRLRRANPFLRELKCQISIQDPDGYISKINGLIDRTE